MRWMHLLTIRKLEKFVPPTQMDSGKGERGKGELVLPVGGYELAVDVGCGVGLCWNIGEA